MNCFASCVPPEPLLPDETVNDLWPTVSANGVRALRRSKTNVPSLHTSPSIHLGRQRVGVAQKCFRRFYAELHTVRCISAHLNNACLKQKRRTTVNWRSLLETRVVRAVFSDTSTTSCDKVGSLVFYHSL